MESIDSQWMTISIAKVVENYYDYYLWSAAGVKEGVINHHRSWLLRLDKNWTRTERTVACCVCHVRLHRYDTIISRLLDRFYSLRSLTWLDRVTDSVTHRLSHFSLICIGDGGRVSDNVTWMCNEWVLNVYIVSSLCDKLLIAIKFIIVERKHHQSTRELRLNGSVQNSC